MSGGGSWEESLFALFDDLEQQAEGLQALEREVEVADRSRSEYAAVTLDSRLMASLDREVGLDVAGHGRLEGRLERVAAGWCLLTRSEPGPGAATEWIVRTEAVHAADGLSDRSIPEVAWSPVAKLGLGSALRRIAAAEERCVVHLIDGRVVEARPQRVGADFVEVLTGEARRLVIAHRAIAVVRRAE